MSLPPYAHSPSSQRLLYTSPETRRLTLNAGDPQLSIDDNSRPRLWLVCALLLWDHEKRLTAKWHEELNAMLLFAGLFSAAVTAFVVAYYITLGTNNSLQILALMHISSQLSSFTINSGSNQTTYINSTQPMLLASLAAASVLDPSIPTDIYALWFLALVLSLAAASIAIYAKQWLNQHATPNTITDIARDSVVIWYCRYQGYNRYGVEIIMGVVPILLQLALIIFLLGLVLLLQHVRTPVTATVSTVVGLLLLFSALISIWPVFDVHCPYKSPQALFIMNILTLIRESSRLIEWATLYFGKLAETMIEAVVTAPQWIIGLLRVMHRAATSSDRADNTPYPELQKTQQEQGKYGHALNEGGLRKIFQGWLEYERHHMTDRDKTVTDATLLAAADNALILNDSWVMLQEVLRPYVKVSPLSDTSVVLHELYNARDPERSEVNIATKFEALVTDAIGTLMGHIDQEEIPETFLELIKQLLEKSSLKIFQSLIVFLGSATLSNYRPRYLKVLLRLVLQNMKRFVKDLDDRAFTILVPYLSYAVEQQDYNLHIHITMELLMACGRHKEADLTLLSALQGAASVDLLFSDHPAALDVLKKLLEVAQNMARSAWEQLDDAFRLVTKFVQGSDEAERRLVASEYYKDKVWAETAGWDEKCADMQAEAERLPKERQKVGKDQQDIEKGIDAIPYLRMLVEPVFSPDLKDLLPEARVWSVTNELVDRLTPGLLHNKDEVARFTETIVKLYGTDRLNFI